MDRDHTQLWYIVRSTNFSFAWYVFGREMPHQGQGLRLVTRENCIGLRRSMRKNGLPAPGLDYNKPNAVASEGGLLARWRLQFTGFNGNLIACTVRVPTQVFGLYQMTWTFGTV